MAINDIKIKSHDIYLENDGKNNGGNLQIGAEFTNGSLTVYGNVKMSSPIINMSAINSVNINSLSNVDINTPGLTVTANEAFNINTPILNLTSSDAFNISGNVHIGELGHNASLSIYGDASIRNGSSIYMSASTIDLVSQYNPVNITASYPNSTSTLVISSTSVNLSASKASFNVTTSNFIISPASLNITAPNVVVNTNKIDLIQNNKTKPINIDDFINYTPSTIPSEYKYDSAYPLDMAKYTYWSGTRLNDTSSGYGFTTSYSAGFYYMSFKYNLLETHLKSIYQGTNINLKSNINAILTVEGFNSSLNTNAKLSLTTSNISINPSTSTTVSSMVINFDTTNFDKFNNSIINLSNKTSYLTFKINNYINDDYHDAKLSINKYAEVEVASHRDLLIKPASNSGTNISYFPNMEYSNEYLHSVVVPSTTVVVNAGEFVEVFPAQDGSYDTCVYLSNNGILPGAPGNTLTVNLGKGNGYIYYYINPENKTDKKLYFYGNNNVTVFSFNSGDPSYNFKFRSGASTSAGEKYMIIKK